MQAQAPVPTNPGRVVDDPLAPLRLQPLEQISDFWKRYDRLADIHDKTLTSNLNGNLDVLLIFAALFSAINTTFISITMPDLSPSPSDETNTLLRLLVMRADNNTLTPADLSPPFSPSSTSIIVNCLLYASLSCSLLAAVGAMMAKEWLQSFNRSGQTGPLEDQGKFRQRKFNGVEQWHLEAVIKFLPNLLLLSVILFFAGICLFLFPINTAVTGTVVAFSGLGVIVSSIAIVAGAISPLCPYQSAASNALRRMVKFSFRSGRILWRDIRRPILGTVLTYGTMMLELAIRVWMQLHRLIRHAFGGQATPEGTSPSGASMDDLGHAPSPSAFSSSISSNQWALAPHSPNTSRHGERNEHKVAAQAASWLLQTTSNRADHVAAARFLRSIKRNACTTGFEGSKSWHRLVFLTREAFDVWESQPSDGNREVAEVFGLALCYMPLPFPEDILEGERENKFDSRQKRTCGLGEGFLQALELARAKNEGDEESIFHLALLSTLLSKDRTIKEWQWANLSKLFLVDANPRPLIADNLLGMWAYGAYRISGGWEHEIRGLEELMEIGGKTERLTDILTYAIGYSLEGLQSVQGHPQFELNAARAYSACLRRARELVGKSSAADHNLAARGVKDLMLSYFDPMIVSDSGSTPVELVKLSKEALLGLRDFTDTKANENGPSVVRTSESKQLFDHHFVGVVADILLDDPGISMRGILVGSSSIKILLWVWKNMSEVSLTDQERHEIFLATSQLWAPLEKHVEFSRTGKVRNRGDGKPLIHDDLKRLTEFIDYIRKDRANSDFISRNADVGINRLYLPFEQGVDWEYELFDFREPRRLCCRSSYLERGLL